MNFRELQRCVVELEIPYDVEIRCEVWADPAIRQALYIVEENVLYVGDDLENLQYTIIEDYRQMGLREPILKLYKI